MTKMRAKLKIIGVNKYPSSERLSFTAVCKDAFPADGTDENNTFAKWTPSAELGMLITNPDLLGKFEVGQQFYVDFSPADAPMSVQLLDVSEATVESEIIAKGLIAPRVTPERIDFVIVNTEFYVFPGTTLTVCCLTLANGYTVLGESACASPENFNAEIGQKIAKANAREKIWALEGYALRERLAASCDTD